VTEADDQNAQHRCRQNRGADHNRLADTSGRGPPSPRLRSGCTGTRPAGCRGLALGGRLGIPERRSEVEFVAFVLDDRAADVADQHASRSTGSAAHARRTLTSRSGTDRRDLRGPRAWTTPSSMPQPCQHRLDRKPHPAHRPRPAPPPPECDSPVANAPLDATHHWRATPRSPCRFRHPPRSTGLLPAQPMNRLSLIASTVTVRGGAAASADSPTGRALQERIEDYTRTPLQAVPRLSRRGARARERREWL